MPLLTPLITVPIGANTSNSAFHTLVWKSTGTRFPSQDTLLALAGTRQLEDTVPNSAVTKQRCLSHIEQL